MSTFEQALAINRDSAPAMSKASFCLRWEISTFATDG